MLVFLKPLDWPTVLIEEHYSCRRYAGSTVLARV